MVSVGLVMLPRRISGLPAITLSFGVVVSTSGLLLSDTPGVVPGQTLTVVVLKGGCHAGF
jgi:hypothetical protein